MAGTTTILVTDMATSTEMLTRTGDEAGTIAITSHLRLVRETVERHGGRVAKTLGDGAMVLFDSAYGAVRAAIALQQDVELAARQSAAPPTGMRIGCNVGEVIAHTDLGAGEDFFGRRSCSRTERARTRAPVRSSSPIWSGC